MKPSAPAVMLQNWKVRGLPMPYATNVELPASVRNHLPDHAQDIYREAFNHAYAAHQGDMRQEEVPIGLHGLPSNVLMRNPVTLRFCATRNTT
jgi:ChaB protein